MTTFKLGTIAAPGWIECQDDTAYPTDSTLPVGTVVQFTISEEFGDADVVRAVG
jgi:hypothetical protein